MYRYLARYYMAMRECLVPPQRTDTQAEVLADLHLCVDNLKARTLELDARANRCVQQATVHARLVEREKTDTGRARERQRAQLYLEERRRVRAEYDKALRMTHLLQAQIDNVVATQVDSLIVDTMRAYSLNAARLAMPARTDQLTRLGEELSERNGELDAMQEAMAGVFASSDGNNNSSSEADLLQELECLLREPEYEEAEPAGLKQRRAAPPPKAAVEADQPPKVDEPEDQQQREEERPRAEAVPA